MKLQIAAALGLIVLAAPAVSSAHFILELPQSAVQEDKLGNPQKAAPCGLSEKTSGTASAAITPVVGGSMLHVKVQETVYHPGHFRIALSVLDRAELPMDPEDMTKDGPKGPISVSAKIDPNPKAPLLVDGLWDHHEKHPLQEFETDVKMPNINCDHCTLQVIQFMEEHGMNAEGRFTYHHCADLKITANAMLPIDTAWPGQKAAAAKGKPAPKAKAKS